MRGAAISAEKDSPTAGELPTLAAPGFVAPTAAQLAAPPAAWYLFGRSEEVRRGPLTKYRLGHELVAYRTESGKIVVLAARCSHLGADLGRGTIAGDCIRCPFHHWNYADDGRCVQIPSQTTIPSFAGQQAFPAVERHGLIFFWNGSEPAYELPFFEGIDPAELERGRPFTFEAVCSWYLLVANGFDAQHFQSVHDRRLLEQPRMMASRAQTRAMEYDAEIVGDSIFDRLLRRFVGRNVRISITNQGGPLVFVKGDFRRAKSRILIAINPLPQERTQVEVIVFGPRSRNGLAALINRWIGLEIRRWFTQGFMEDDIAKLPGIVYNPATLVESDRMMVEFLQWLAALPKQPGSLDPRKSR